MLHRNTNRAVCWTDGMYKQCENRFFFQITAGGGGYTQTWAGGTLCIMYFVFRKCAAVRLRLRIRTQYYIMVFGGLKSDKKVQFSTKPARTVCPKV